MSGALDELEIDEDELEVDVEVDVELDVVALPQLAARFCWVVIAFELALKVIFTQPAATV